MATSDTVTNLTTARDQIAAKLAEITANPKAAYSIDGQSVDHNAYRKSLIEELKQIQELLVILDPYIVVSQVL